MRVYEIMARVSLADNASAAMAALAARALHLEGKIGSLTKAFSELNRVTLLVGGGLAVFGGVRALEGLNKMVQHGEKLVHVQQQLVQAGLSQKEVAEATAKAWETAGKLGLNVSSVLADIKEMRLVFGSTEHATTFIDQLERMRVVLNSVTEGSGDKLKGAVYDMARAGELKGLTETKDFLRYFPQMTQAIAASGGKVDPKAFFQATQYGRLASFGLSEEFYTKYLPTIVQSMRPSTAGVSLQSLLMQGAMGHIGARGTQAWIEAGLIEDPSKLITSKRATKKAGELFGGWNFGAVKESELLVSNPYEWAQKVLRPLLQEKFGANVTANDPRVIGFLGTLFTNRVAQQGIAEFALQGRRFDRDRGLIEQAKGPQNAEWLLEHDPTAVMNRFKNSWDNLMTAFSEPLVEPKLKMMNAVSEAMKGMSKLALEHPEVTKLIGETFGSLAVGLAVLGGAAVISGLVLLAGPGGLVAALATAIALLASQHWDALAAYMKDFDAGIDSLLDPLRNMAALGLKKLADGLNWVADGLGKLWEKIKEYFGYGTQPQPGSYEGGGFGGASIMKASYGGSAGSFGGGTGGGGGLMGGSASPFTGTGSRSWRNNNPGNLEYGPFAIAHGAIGTDGRFAIFPTEEAGQKAREALVFGKYGGLSAAAAIGKYAPASENDTAAYIRRALEGTGASSGTILSSFSQEQRKRFLENMQRIEGWRSGANKNPLIGGAFGGANIPLSGAAAAAGAGYATGHMHPEFQKRLAAMTAAAAASGHPLSVFSGWRSQEHQNRLFAASHGSGMVARHSMHTRGLAADLRGDLAWAHKHAHEYGLTFPMPWENWHVEPEGGRTGTFTHNNAHLRRPHQSHQTEIHTNLHLDGRVIARHVTRHQVAAATHSHQAPHFDGRRLYSGPDRQVNTG